MLLQTLRATHRFELDPSARTARGMYQPLCIVHIHVTNNNACHSVSKINPKFLIKPANKLHFVGPGWAGTKGTAKQNQYRNG